MQFIRLLFMNEFKSSRWVLSLVVITILVPGTVLGQQEWEKDGGIPSAEIQIVKDRQIVLPPADRNFDKIPPRPAEPIKPEIIYQFKNLRFNTPDFSPAIRPLKLKQEDISKIYGNYISAGYGNFASPYLEAGFNAKRNKTAFYGAHFYHHSFGKGPVDGKNSASGTTDVNVYGKAMSNSVVASGNINYENRNTYFYGYAPGQEPSRDDIRQHYNLFSLGAGLENSKSGDFDYSLKGGFSNLTDNYAASETEIGLRFNSAYKSTEKAQFLVNADYYLIDHKDAGSDFKPRNLFRAKPAYRFTPIDRIWLTIGVNAAYENDDIGKNKSFHAYPNLRADYSLSDAVTAYATLNGDIDKVSLQSLTRENLWVASNINVYHTNRSVELASGLKGTAGKKLSFGTGFSVSNLKNLYFFRNSSLDASKFEVVYDDGNVQRLNLFGELGYNHGDVVKLALRGDFYQYTTDHIQEAYYRPTYRLDFNSTYSLYSKLVFNVDFIAQGGMKGYDVVAAQSVSIKPALDLSTRVDYFVSKRVSAFVKLNNMLSSNYQLYLNYPVRGFQAMGGVTWSF